MNRLPGKSLYTNELRQRNILAYKGVPPSLELIKSVIEKSKIRYVYRFEHVHGMTLNVIAKCFVDPKSRNYRPLNAVYWHIFYEYDRLDKFYANFKRKKNKIKKQEVIKTTPQLIAQTNKSIIDAIRSRVNK